MAEVALGHLLPNSAVGVPIGRPGTGLLAQGELSMSTIEGERWDARQPVEPGVTVWSHPERPLAASVVEGIGALLRVPSETIWSRLRHRGLASSCLMFPRRV